MLTLDTTISTDEMIQEFLGAEIRQERYHTSYSEALCALHVKTSFDSFIKNPIFAQERRKLFEIVRGWPDKLLFTHFPHPITWYRTILKYDDLKHLSYINYSYWNEISKGTQSPLIAAKTIKDGQIIYDQSNDTFWEIADLVRQGESFDPVIVLRVKDDAYTIIEGHHRITGFALAGKVPLNHPCIVGVANEASALKWSKENKT